MNMIVAYCKNNGIGIKNTIPWYIPKDFRRFKKLTEITNNKKTSNIIMGRNTWDSLPRKPLPERNNIILSNTLTYSEVKKYDNISIFSKKCELDTHIMELTEKKAPVWIIGGSFLYNHYINHPYLDKIYITKILHDYECDTFFPLIPSNFSCVSASEVHNYKNIDYQFLIYKNNLGVF